MRRLPELTKEAEIRVRLRNERKKYSYPVFLGGISEIGLHLKKKKEGNRTWAENILGKEC